MTSNDLPDVRYKRYRCPACGRFIPEGYGYYAPDPQADDVSRGSRGAIYCDTGCYGRAATAASSTEAKVADHKAEHP